MAQTIEQLEQLINEVAQEVGRKFYGLKPHMFRIYIQPDLPELARSLRGPTVQIYTSITPFDPDFRKVIHDLLRGVKRLYNPLSVEPFSYVLERREHSNKWRRDSEEWVPDFIIDEGRLKVVTKTVTEVIVTDMATNKSVTLRSSEKTTWALQHEAKVQLTRLIYGTQNTGTGDAGRGVERISPESVAPESQEVSEHDSTDDGSKE